MGWMARLCLASCVLACSPGEATSGRDASAPSDSAPLPDRGTPADLSDVAPTLTIAVDYAGAECAEHSVAHTDPAYLLRIAVEGPPNATVAVWASRPGCGGEPFFFREVTTDAEGRGSTILENTGLATCDDALLGAWQVWAQTETERSEAAAVVIGHAGCMLDCAAAASHCPPTAMDAGVPDAGSVDAGTVDAGPPELDAGPPDMGGPVTETLLSESGCFFTPTTAEKLRSYRIGTNGTVYDRLDIRFDVIAGPYQPHIPDPGDRTEHILFGLGRANRPRSFERYVMGAAAVDYLRRADVFRMYGRDEIAMGYMSYNSVAQNHAWSEGTRYTVRCFLDAPSQVQRCELEAGGAVVAMRQIPVAWLDAATHLSTAFDFELGTDQPLDNNHLQSPRGWTFCDAEVIGHPR